MRRQPREFFEESQQRTSAILKEFLIRETSFFTPVERHNLFEYVESLAKELSNISNKANNSFLSYLLNLAVEEAQLAKRTAGREISVP